MHVAVSVKTGGPRCGCPCNTSPILLGVQILEVPTLGQGVCYDTWHQNPNKLGQVLPRRLRSPNSHDTPSVGFLAYGLLGFDTCSCVSLET